MQSQTLINKFAPTHWNRGLHVMNGVGKVGVFYQNLKLKWIDSNQLKVATWRLEMKHWTKCHLEFEKVSKKLIKKTANVL